MYWCVLEGCARQLNAVSAQPGLKAEVAEGMQPYASPLGKAGRPQAGRSFRVRGPTIGRLDKAHTLVALRVVYYYKEEYRRVIGVIVFTLLVIFAQCTFIINQPR